MIHFVVVAGKPAAVSGIAPRLSRSLEATRLFDGELVERMGTSQTWATAAIAIPDPVCEVRLAADGDSMVVVNGPALAVDRHQRGLAEHLLRRFTSGGTPGVAGSLAGSYNFVGVAPSQGVRVFVDFSGLSPIYWHESTDFVAFSNRSTTIASLIGSEGWDVRSLAWVIGHANLFGERMPARAVSYLPPGREAHVEWGDSLVRLEVSPVWVWPAPAEDKPRDNLRPDEWEEITDTLVANFRSLRTLSAPLRLSLTGGKDTRLCLALAKAAGLQDLVETFTSGQVDNPEVECAAAVARAAGFPHTRTGPSDAAQNSPEKPEFDPGAVWRRLRQHAYRFEAIVCPWDGMTGPLRNTTLTIKGFGGEFYRRARFGFESYRPARLRLTEIPSVETMASMFVDYHQPHDPMGVLRAEEAAFQAQWLKSWVYDAAQQVRFDVVPEKSYVDYRLGHWTGPLGQATAGRITVNPLLSSTAVTKNLELSARTRSSDRLHFEVMRRAVPELLTVPFLKDVWSAEIAADSTIELPRHPYPTKVNPYARTLSSWQWPFLESQGKAIEALLDEAARKTDMGAICDMKKLKRIARRSARLQNKVKARTVLSAVYVALSLLGHAEAVLDEP